MKVFCKSLGVLALVLTLTLCFWPAPAIADTSPLHAPVRATDVEIGTRSTVSSNAPTRIDPSTGGYTGTLGTPLPADGTRYAIVYGLNDYPGTINDLRGCVTDALSMKTALVDKYGFLPENIISRRDSAVHRSTLFADIDEMRAKLLPQDELFFFYSGHGAKGKAEDLDRNKTDQSIVIWDDTVNTTSLVWDGELKQAFQGFQTSRIVFVFDSCFSGGMSVLSAPGRVVATACTATQLSSETILGGAYHGVFTYYFVNQGMTAGLAPKSGTFLKYISVEGAFQYAKTQIATLKNFGQTAVLTDQFSNDLVP